LTTLQLALIWPAVPVSGVMFPIFTMAAAKSGGEERRVGAVLLHHIILRPAVGEHLVRVQQGAHEVAVVGVVEEQRRLRVERRQVGVAAALRGGAGALAQRRERRVDVGVVVDVVARSRWCARRRAPSCPAGPGPCC